MRTLVTNNVDRCHGCHIAWSSLTQVEEDRFKEETRQSWARKCNSGLRQADLAWGKTDSMGSQANLVG